MPTRFLAALGAALALLLALPAQAAGFGDPDIDVARRLLEVSLREDIPDTHPRLAQTREQLQRVAKASGQNENAIAQICMRNARYAFEASRTDVRPLEVLEAAARFHKAGQPLSETTQRYVALRLQKLDHAGALAQMTGGR